LGVEIKIDETQKIIVVKATAEHPVKSANPHTHTRTHGEGEIKKGGHSCK